MKDIKQMVCDKGRQPKSNESAKITNLFSGTGRNRLVYSTIASFFFLLQFKLIASD